MALNNALSDVNIKGLIDDRFKKTALYIFREGCRMKRRFLLMLTGFFLAGLIAGCGMAPPKQYVEALPKTKFTVIGDITTYKDVEQGGFSEVYVKDIGKQTNDPSYIELADFYSATLKEKLIENGFVVLDTKSPEASSALVINTKLGYSPPKFLIRYGTINARIEVVQNGKLILSFDESVVTGSFPLFSETLPDIVKTQVRRFIVPRAAKKLKEKFLEQE